MHVNTGSHRCSPYLDSCFTHRVRHEQAQHVKRRITRLPAWEPGQDGGETGALGASADMHRARQLIRLLVGAALCAALTTYVFVSVPENLPSVAFGQPAIYRLQAALLVFYGTLLLVTPAYSGLAWGRLPIEISTHGAKFFEDADRSASLNEAAMSRMRRVTANLTQALADTEIEVERLRGIVESDSTKQGVNSNK